MTLDFCSIVMFSNNVTIVWSLIVAAFHVFEFQIWIFYNQSTDTNFNGFSIQSLDVFLK